MTTEGCKRLVIALSALVVLLTAATAWLLSDRTLVQIRVAFAVDQTEIIDEMRGKALRSSPAAAAAFLQYAVHYYPSGTKQEAGSRLDQIVERQRANAVREIIAHLRSKTGQDLGDDPQVWIDTFGSK
jgi:hypothetical protein